MMATASKPKPPRGGAPSQTIKSASGNKNRQNHCLDPAQDIVFIDMDKDKKKTNDKTKIRENHTTSRIDQKVILEISKESTPEAVYEIILRAEKIAKIENLNSFRKCRSLDLSSNLIERLENLDSLKDLRELKCYDNKLTKIANLENLTELTNLLLQHNQITSIGDGLKKLKKLRQLRLDNNQITEIAVKELSYCSVLTSLDLSYNNITDITPLNCLVSIEELRISHNRLKQITDLKRCRKLEELDISGNKIVDLSGLKGLPALSSLDVSQNNLSTLSSMGSSKTLRDLNISYNKFSEVEKLISAFPELEVLRVSYNKIDSTITLLKLKSCLNLAELYVEGNPFYDATDNHVTLFAELSSAIPNLDILNGAQVHRKSRSAPVAPLMRPMSANSIISVRQVEHQMKTLDTDMHAIEMDLSKKFEAMGTSITALPPEPPKRDESRDVKSRDIASRDPGARVDLVPPMSTTSRPGTSSRQSRCSSRSKLSAAMAYASANFDS